MWFDVSKMKMSFMLMVQVGFEICSSLFLNIYVVRISKLPPLSSNNNNNDWAFFKFIIENLSVDPIRDAELINLELAFADLAQVEQRVLRIRKETRAGKGDPNEPSALEKVQEVLEADKPARYAELTDDEEASIKSLGLLTRKPMIYAANVADADLAEGNEMVEKLKEISKGEGAKMVIVSAQVEAELVELEPDDRAEFLESLGVTLEDCGLRALIREAYDLLQLQTYYTSGPTGTSPSVECLFQL